jgi:hypothetical protein
VVLVDGAEHQLDLIRAEAARRGVTISIVIDLIHVLEYIWKAAWCLHPAGDPAAEDWVAVKALAVLAGDSARAAAEITAEAGAAGLSDAQRTGTDACVRYLTSKDEYLRYDQALAAGWPIATGVIEGACRHLIGDRLDITGARWGLDGAEAVLTLRAVIANGHFDDYWRYHLAREHQRLYPGTAQGPYTLGACPLTPNEPHPSAILVSAARNASNVGRFGPPCHTNSSVMYSCATLGSRDSPVASIRLGGTSGAASHSSSLRRPPIAGLDSTSPARSWLYRWAYRMAIMPPMECPTITTGSSSLVACTTARRSSTTTSRSSKSTRSPGDRPWPM